MKKNISDSLLEKTIEKMTKLNEEALKELGFINSDEEVDLSEDQEQQIIEFIIEKGIFTNSCYALRSSSNHIMQFLKVCLISL